MATTEERVKKIVIDLLGVDESRVVQDASFRDDLEADSLDLVELIMAFEEEFGGEHIRIRFCLIISKNMLSCGHYFEHQ